MSECIASFGQISASMNDITRGFRVSTHVFKPLCVLLRPPSPAPSTVQMLTAGRGTWQPSLFPGSRSSSLAVSSCPSFLLFLSYYLYFLAGSLLDHCPAHLSPPPLFTVYEV